MQTHYITTIRLSNPLIAITIALLLTACSSNTPSTERMERQIANQLIKDTMGQLFEVESVSTEPGTFTKEGDYLVNASYTLKYTHTLEEYLTYLFKDTPIDGRIDGTEVKREVGAKIVNKYGQPSVGATRRFHDSFVFRKEAFGWEVQSPRDLSAIKSFLP